MKFKDDVCRKEFYETPTLLQVICADFEKLSLEYGIDPLITRVFESVPGDSGVHECHRAVDFRDEHPVGVFAYSSGQRDSITKSLNDKYARLDHKPTILFHSFNGGPVHVHIQMALNPKVYAKIN